MPDKIGVAILGGSGYVAGEAYRLLSGHPIFEVAAISSSTQAGVTVGSVFPHLVGASKSFCSPDEIFASGQVQAVISALPHGESESTLLGYAQDRPALKIVDLSADLRFHPSFHCGLPELFAGDPGRLVANPGCFASCTTLAAAPLLELPTADLVAFGVTGSTGSGRSPKPTTHHPERHSGFWAYEPLKHRHKKEIEMMLRLDEQERNFVFLPHSAPMSRGMHVTVATLIRESFSVSEVVGQFREFYRDCPMVHVRESGFPNVKDVVGSNYCHVGVAVENEQVAVMAVIDNLVKGAAGGGVQWLNRMFGLPDETGLTAPALGWN